MYLLADVVVNERSDWGARAPRSVTKSTAPFGWTQHYEGPAMGSFAHSSCAAKVRGIQNFHMDARGWSDFAYNWLVCPHGVIFEGRGAGVKSAANGTTSGNASARAICGLWGAGDAVTALAQHAIATLGGFLHLIGDCGPGRNCHLDWKPTACPGLICEWIKAGAIDPLPAGPGVPPTPPAAVPFVPQTGPQPALAVLDGHVYAFVRGTDGALWVQRDGDGWRSIGGALASGPAAVTYDGRLDVFAAGVDSHLWHIFGDGAASWSGWEDLGGLLTSGPAAAVVGDRIELAVRGRDAAVHRLAWTGAAWSGWWSVGGAS